MSRIAAKIGASFQKADMKKLYILRYKGDLGAQINGTWYEERQRDLFFESFRKMTKNKPQAVGKVNQFVCAHS